MLVDACLWGEHRLRILTLEVFDRESQKQALSFSIQTGKCPKERQGQCPNFGHCPCLSFGHLPVWIENERACFWLSLSKTSNVSIRRRCSPHKQASTNISA